MPPRPPSGFRSSAFSKLSRGIASASEYIGPRVEAAVDGASSKLHEMRRDRKDSWEVPEGVLTTPKNAVKARSRQSSLDTISTSSSASFSTSSTSESRSSRWGLSSITGYFTSEGKEKRAQEDYTEEKIVCFPGFATLRPSAHSASEPALVLEISAAGYAYRLRPINQASRSQRVFYSLARSFAALPRIPTDFLPAGLNPEGAQSVESLSTKETDLAEDTKGSIFERLLEIGGREGGRDEEEELKAAIVEEPEPLVPLDDAAAPTHSVASRPPALPDVPESSIVPDAATVGRRPHIMSRNSSNSVPLRRSTASATSPPSSRPSSPTPRSRPSSIIHHSPLNPSSLPTSPTSSGASTPTSPSSSSHPFPKSHPHPKSHDKHHEGFPLPFSFIEADLPRLHANLHDRLLAFFGQKLGMRRVRLTVYPELGTWDKPLATKVVTTSTGGAFATNMEVRSKELRKLLEDLGEGVEALEKLRIRVVAELLEVDPVDLLSGGLLAHHAMKTTAEDDAVLKVGKDGGVHVISDIDDTVKWTEVLGGTKTIFRNVFVRELHEIRVPGMAEWYRAMEELGATFSYVSNSPWELWGVVREYLHSTGFPSGSVTLKEYGGASSAIAKLWEEPGMRKRAGVEVIFRQFPHSRFILIGDSGEQDLNLYVALAQVYPTQVLGIFIRDVTTPFAPNLHPDLPVPSFKPATDARPFSEFPDLPGSFDGSHERPLPLHSPKPIRPSLSSRARSSFTRSAPPSPPPPLLEDPTADPLSPNNPTRPQVAPLSQSEEQEALIHAFYEKLAAAEKVLPEGISLSIFRHGGEVSAEGVELVRRG